MHTRPHAQHAVAAVVVRCPAADPSMVTTVSVEAAVIPTAACPSDPAAAGIARGLPSISLMHTLSSVAVTESDMNCREGLALAAAIAPTAQLPALLSDFDMPSPPLPQALGASAPPPASLLLCQSVTLGLAMEVAVAGTDAAPLHAEACAPDRDSLLSRLLSA